MAKGPNQRLRQRSTLLLLTLIILGFGAAIGRLAYLQLGMGEFLQQQAVEQQLADTTINARRGTIYDRNGEVLAKSASVWQVVLAPAYFETEEERRIVAKGLSEILDLEEQSVFEKTQRNVYYVIVKRRIDSEKREEIIKFIDKLETEYDIKSVITLIDDFKRYYPHNELASSVLGFTGSDDQGLGGIEYQYDEYLKGKAGRIITAQNANGTNMPFQFKQSVDAETGNDLKLTVDATIQAIVEKYMEKGLIDNAVENRGACIVMNPNTGEILAMSTVGGYNLNKPFELDTKIKARIDALPAKEQEKATNEALNEQWRNKAISDIYYPGSVFKMITSSMALEENLVNSRSTFSCGGSFNVMGSNIHCHKTNGHGTQSFHEAIWNSCNPAFIQIGQLIGIDKFCEYYQAFGFSEKTGIDLPGESEDMFYDEMTLVDLAVSSFGQNFGITPIQMITAASVVANGGKLVTPHVVSQITDASKNVVKTTETEIKRQVISKGVSDELCGVLEENAVTGGAKNAYIAGYRVAGKTGTTEKIGLSKQEGVKDYISSFCGFAPAEKPEVIALIIFDTPRGDSYYGSMVAAPVFANIMSEILSYLEVETQYTEAELEQIDISVESFLGLKTYEARTKAQNSGLTVSVQGDGDTVLSQIPEAGSSIPRGGNIVLYTDIQSAQENVAVPNFIGYSLAEIMYIASENNINVSVLGATTTAEALSTEQSIPEGELVSPGTVVKVTFISGGTND